MGKTTNHEAGSKGNRKQVNDGISLAAISELERELFRRLDQKGRGTYASRHEILGVVIEETDRELVKAVHEGTLGDVRSELLDIAVACVFGVACIDAEAVDW